MRGLTTGAVHLGLLGHLGYFLVMIVGRAGGGRPAARRPAPEMITPGAERGVAGDRRSGPTMSACRSPPDRSASTDLARDLAVAALAVIQIVVAGHGRERRAGEDVGDRRPLVPHARAARGLDVRHLGR